MKATFGAGCFWHVELAFSKVDGVKSTAVGYMGGKYKNPTYEDVCAGFTGHAEVCQVEFDPKKVSYEMLLNLFWSIHDPTTFNRQGLDVGEQYRSVIFYHNEKQKKLAQASLEMEQQKQKKKIVTQIAKAGKFWKAEEYHQKYMEKSRRKVC